MVLADSPTSSSSTERALRDAEEGRLASSAAAPGPTQSAMSPLPSPTSMRSAVPGPESIPNEPAQSPQRLRAPSRSGAFGDRSHRALSEKAKGKQRASSEPQPSGGLFPNLVQSPVDEDGPSSPIKTSSNIKRRTGRAVTIIFSGEEDGTSEGNLDIWVEDGESIGSVKDQVRLFRKAARDKSLRIIHSGRLLTDGVLLVAWMRSLEERVKRQAGTMGSDVGNVLKDVGLAEEEEEGTGSKDKGGARIWLHCVVGAKVEERTEEKEEETTAPRRRGFDVLLDAGLSPADVAQMRRQFYESRGEEVPEDMGETNDEHARALEEQWIEGDMTADTATTTTEGMFTSILHGLLTGFLFPIMPWFFFRDMPLPNFFDADAAATGQVDDGGVSSQVAESGVGGEIMPSVVFGKRMQMGILFGTVLNLAFGALRFLN